MEYGRIGKIYSVALDSDIHFNAKGFNHLIYGGLNKRRSYGDIVRRMKLLHQAVFIVKKAKSISEYRSSAPAHDSGEIVEYWKLEMNKVVVILRRRGRCAIIFYSVWNRR